MAVPIVDAEYSLMQFTNIEYAAAFVAALSRYLSSPEGRVYFRPAAAAEVWSYVAGDTDAIERIDIYLNQIAIKAAKDAFGSISMTEMRRGKHLPRECILLIGAGGVEAWGLEEAQWHIMAER